MTKQPNKFFVAVILLGWIFDFLFWDKTVGVNFPIFSSVCLGVGLLLLRSYDIKPAGRSLWLLIPIAFFAVITFIRQEPLTIFLAYTISIISMGLLAVTYLGGRWTEYSLSDYFVKVIRLMEGFFVLPGNFYRQIREEQAERGQAAKKFQILPVLRGLALALPVVACFGTLLASADLVFEQKLVEFFDIFDAGLIFEYLSRIIIILICAYLLAGVYLHAASRSKDEKLIGEEKPVITPFIGFTESAIVLGSVAFLFAAFVTIQLQYFFGGNVNIGVEGFTYSQYARRGFSELITVAIFSLLLILGLSTITKRETDSQRRAYSGLSVVIVTLVMVILVSAYQRLSLGIEWHGYSRFRLYPRVFLIWVGILFLAVVALEVFHRERYFALAAVMASIGFAVSLSLFNVDASIVSHNVLRATQGRHFNVNYLASLSTDAIPALADEFMDPSLPVKIHEGIGAALMCHLYTNDVPIMVIEDWRSFNLSRWKAKEALKVVQPELDSYRVNKSKRPTRVRTPSNTLYECPN